MYYLIGISLLLTFFFLIALTASLFNALLWRFMAPRSAEWSATARAATVFSLRVLPVALGFVYSVGLAAPAFLLHEPESPDEALGYKQVLLVGACAVGITIAWLRAIGGWWRTRRLIARWTADSEPYSVKGIRLPTFKLRHEFPVFAVVGALRPRLFIAEQLLRELDDQELKAVMKHEIGHLTAFDNVKRVLVKFCADLVVVPVGSEIDSGWVEASEIAADEFAVSHGGRASALSLASALIKIARMIPSGGAPSASGAYAVQNDGELLAIRIRRLLRMADSSSLPEYRGPDFLIRFAAVTVCVVLFMVPVVVDAWFLSRVHDVSESLLEILK